MSFLDAVWMLANFFAPAVGVGLFAPMLAKLLWRHEFAAVRWAPLIAAAMAASALVLVAGLVVFDHDGRMITYGAMTAAAALVMAWFSRKVPSR